VTATYERFDDSIGIFPEFLDGYGILCLPTTGRYFQVPYRITVVLATWFVRLVISQHSRHAARR
jgi:hypothetical protein